MDSVTHVLAGSPHDFASESDRRLQNGTPPRAITARLPCRKGKSALQTLAETYARTECMPRTAKTTEGTQPLPHLLLAPALLFKYNPSGERKVAWLIAYSSPWMTGATRCPPVACLKV